MKNASLGPLLGFAALTVFTLGGYELGGGGFRVLLEALPSSFISAVLGALAATSILSTGSGPGIFASLGLTLRGRRFEKAEYLTLAAAMADALNPGRALARTIPNDDARRMIFDAKALLDQTPDAGLADILQARVTAICGGQKRAVRVLGLLARSLLWFSAIGFVLGLTKTLSAAGNAPNEVIAGMLAHAMVILLPGSFLAAGIVFPLRQRLDAGTDDDANFYQFIRTAFLCRNAGSDPALAVRTTCGALPADLSPDAEDIDAFAHMPAVRPA